LTDDSPGLADILKANRTFIYALLMMPIAGMFIAVGLIIYKKPNNMIVALGVIAFLMVQYGFTVYFFIQRIHAMAEKNEKTGKEKENTEV
jgi:phosphotransferase system  glucose/maltose/N-acetylglucosamine-specific IIC component